MTFDVLEEHGRSMRVSWDGVELARYVYGPWDAQLESPRPYLHPLRTAGGQLVSLYRPHDHVWHKGIAWSLPNVGPANFWGGTTFRRGDGYLQLPNNGAMRHLAFTDVAVGPAAAGWVESLVWTTEQGEDWFTERRELGFATVELGWVLTFATSFTNTAGHRVVIGSPTTEGRPNAGYGGLFWRGPRSFTGGTVHVPAGPGGDELMGVEAPWMGFTGRHDDPGAGGGESTLMFVARTPTKWFVRSEPFACVCPAPFFDSEVGVEPGASLSFGYAVVVADGAPEPARLARCGQSALEITG